MNECIETLKDNNVSALDCSTGYWHINVDERNDVKTALKSQNGL